MTLQEIIKSLDSLSKDDEALLWTILSQRQAKVNGNKFWESLQECRQIIETEQIVFTDDDFANLRDKSPGREVIL
jgi:hypothetical protein